ncbi:MAG TPA: EAL domain-containing protein, partial [Pseudomonadales bacterium]|nr:EAL domain-containing protein [Pseudomonadales bacterium]
DGVPHWFLERVQLQLQSGEADVQSNAATIGHVSVHMDPAEGYMELWRLFETLFSWFAAVGLLSLAALLLLLRASLRPLRQIELQASAICERNFSIQQPLPRTRELRRVVQAINRMTKQIKSVFDEQVKLTEHVRKIAFSDPVTQLGNNAYFDSRLSAGIDDREQPLYGALVVIHLRHFSELNEQFGHGMGDMLLRAVASCLRKTLATQDDKVLARKPGAYFYVLLPHIGFDEARQAAETLVQQIAELEPVKACNASEHVHAGMAYCHLGEDARELVEQAELALRAAQLEESGLKIFGETPLADHVYGRSLQEWRQLLEKTVQAQDAQLYVQPIISCFDRSILHFELFSRLQIKNEEETEIVPARVFMPLVEQFGLEIRFDKMMLLQLVKAFERNQLKGGCVYSLNVFPRSFLNEEFLRWMESVLAAAPGLCRRLLIEVGEAAIAMAPQQVELVARRLRKLGVRLSIDHFGSTHLSFSYLSVLPLYAIKLHFSYVRDVTSNQDHQFFIQSILRIAHSRQMLMLAESVETEAQWDLLRDFQLDGAQGYYLGSPVLL